MFVAHLPAGYLVSKSIAKYHALSGDRYRKVMLAGICGAMAPEIDMLYFNFIDKGQFHHHIYFPHLPITWLPLLIVSSTWLVLMGRQTTALLLFAFSLNGMAHIILDSVVGDIWWFGPWLDKPFSLFSVPALYSPWWLNFLLHWTFIIELLIVVLAIIVWIRSPECKSC